MRSFLADLPRMILEMLTVLMLLGSVVIVALAAAPV